MKYPALDLHLVDLPRSDRVLVTAVSGEIDLATTDYFRQAILARLLRCAKGELVIDLADVPFLDCSGLEAILAAHRRARVLSVAFSLACLRSEPARLLSLSRVDRIVASYETVQAALGSSLTAEAVGNAVRPAAGRAR
jgi:anti-anti-sigma factor